MLKNASVDIYCYFDNFVAINNENVVVDISKCDSEAELQKLKLCLGTKLTKCKFACQTLNLTKILPTKLCYRGCRFIYQTLVLDDIILSYLNN